MKKITEVTYQDLIDVILNGFDCLDDNLGLWEPEEVHIEEPFYGRISEVEFLNRLYELKKWPPLDGRFGDAFDDIRSHYLWGDFEDDAWIFSDERFHLSANDEDEYLLRFICEMLHPAVRNEKGQWKAYLKKFNELLKYDGYELYASQFVSGRSVYSYREYSGDTENFIEENLFTRRYSEFIRISGEYDDRISNCVDYNVKRKLCRVILEFAEPQKIKINRYDSFEEDTDAVRQAMKRLEEVLGYPAIFWDFNIGFASGEETLANCFTPFLFDIIEFQNDELSSMEKGPFQESINKVFLLAKLPFKLTDRGLMERTVENEVLSPEIIDRVAAINEPGVKQLLDIAIDKHMKPTAQDKKDAVEKIWDAFERIKTVFPGDKRDSVSELIKRASAGNKEIADMLEKEFRELTNIGNDFRIRHHETNKNEITELDFYEYFFNRCLSVISLVIQHI